MFPATPPRCTTKSSTRKLSDTFCRCSARSCSENRPGKRIRWSVAMDPVTAIVTKCHALHSLSRPGGAPSLRIKSRLYGPTPRDADVARCCNRRRPRRLIDGWPVSAAPARRRGSTVPRRSLLPLPEQLSRSTPLRRWLSHARPPRRNKALLWTLLGLGLVAALVATAVIAGGRGGQTGAAGFSERLQSRDTELPDRVVGRRYRDGGPEHVVRHVRRHQDRKSDMALARLASDAFRKQFARKGPR